MFILFGSLLFSQQHINKMETSRADSTEPHIWRWKGIGTSYLPPTLHPQGCKHCASETLIDRGFEVKIKIHFFFKYSSSFQVVFTFTRILSD